MPVSLTEKSSLSKLMLCNICDCTFSDDGSVRVWRNIEGENYSDKSLEMVTAWQALSGMLPSTRGTYKTLKSRSKLGGDVEPLSLSSPSC